MKSVDTETIQYLRFPIYKYIGYIQFNCLFITNACSNCARRCESQNGSLPEKVNLNGHKEKKINIFSCYTDSTQIQCAL